MPGAASSSAAAAATVGGTESVATDSPSTKPSLPPLTLPTLAPLDFDDLYPRSPRSPNGQRTSPLPSPRKASSSVEEWVLNDAQQAIAAAAGVPTGPPPQMRLHRSLSTKSTASADSAAELQMLLSEFDEMEAAQANARRASVAEKRVTPAEFLATYADPDVLAELERLIAARLHGQQDGQSGEMMGVPEIKVTAASAASGSKNASARSSTVLGMVTHTLEVQPEAKGDDESDSEKDKGEGEEKDVPLATPLQPAPPAPLVFDFATQTSPASSPVVESTPMGTQTSPDASPVLKPLDPMVTKDSETDSATPASNKADDGHRDPDPALLALTAQLTEVAATLLDKLTDLQNRADGHDHVLAALMAAQQDQHDHQSHETAPPAPIDADGALAEMGRALAKLAETSTSVADKLAAVDALVAAVAKDKPVRRAAVGAGFTFHDVSNADDEEDEEDEDDATPTPRSRAGSDASAAHAHHALVRSRSISSLSSAASLHHSPARANGTRPHARRSHRTPHRKRIGSPSAARDPAPLLVARPARGMPMSRHFRTRLEAARRRAAEHAHPKMADAMDADVDEEVLQDWTPPAVPVPVQVDRKRPVLGMATAVLDIPGDLDHDVPKDVVEIEPPRALVPVTLTPPAPAVLAPAPAPVVDLSGVTSQIDRVDDSVGAMRADMDARLAALAVESKQRDASFAAFTSSLMATFTAHMQAMEAKCAALVSQVAALQAERRRSWSRARGYEAAAIEEMEEIGTQTEGGARRRAGSVASTSTSTMSVTTAVVVPSDGSPVIAAITTTTTTTTGAGNGIATVVDTAAGPDSPIWEHDPDRVYGFAAAAAAAAATNANGHSASPPTPTHPPVPSSPMSAAAPPNAAQSAGGILNSLVRRASSNSMLGPIIAAVAGTPASPTSADTPLARNGSTATRASSGATARPRPHSASPAASTVAPAAEGGAPGAGERPMSMASTRSGTGSGGTGNAANARPMSMASTRSDADEILAFFGGGSANSAMHRRTLDRYEPKKVVVPIHLAATTPPTTPTMSLARGMSFASRNASRASVASMSAAERPTSAPAPTPRVWSLMEPVCGPRTTSPWSTLAERRNSLDFKKLNN
ncbi:hypothetical protein AMAG_19475 [Allomyces macrogynus ATCC 38327]|uniref:Uncharacterized protein n=1 Tax=Allomyces macrogynus (strain ATCC 38327) TaxID=578462 RepID=A0A0L0SSK2_ALLM3|nr:hypothetical protein AMAG_19475 [Allomyces macrogynus ATCC 38327]|eukprot:KNE65477.1 hypothetical protein AMAG_19475 [Allomyces macrogynus ATCC 38327]